MLQLYQGSREKGTVCMSASTTVKRAGWSCPRPASSFEPVEPMGIKAFCQFCTDNSIADASKAILQEQAGKHNWVVGGL